MSEPVKLSDRDIDHLSRLLLLSMQWRGLSIEARKEIRRCVDQMMVEAARTQSHAFAATGVLSRIVAEFDARAE